MIWISTFDIILKRSDYHPLLDDNTIYCEDQSPYKPPQLEPVQLENDALESKICQPDFVKKLILMQCKKLYKHIGPGVMKAHADFSAIDESLLLQVAQKEGDLEKEMRLVAQLFGKTDGFRISGSLPNSVKNEEVATYIEKMVNQYKIKAFKLHPIITGIDISKSSGKERIENVLISCSDSNLPLVIHGGTSYLYKNQPEETYTVIENLEKINWSMSNSFVIIAHAAAYDCELDRIEKIILPKLNKMMDIHGNLLIDISGIGYKTLCAVLKHIDIERIIFGSDSLYSTQWVTMVRLFHALHNFPNSTNNFLKIISLNPQKTIFNET